MQAKETVKKLTDKLQSSDLETRPGRTMLETFEDEVNQALNKARDDSGKEAQRSLDSTNNVVRMVSAGSKGSFINISQVWPYTFHEAELTCAYLWVCDCSLLYHQNLLLPRGGPSHHFLRVGMQFILAPHDLTSAWQSPEL